MQPATKTKTQPLTRNQKKQKELTLNGYMQRKEGARRVATRRVQAKQGGTGEGRDSSWEEQQPSREGDAPSRELPSWVVYMIYEERRS